MLNAVLVVLTVAYPAAVYFGLEYLEPRYFALILISLFAARYLLTTRSAQRRLARSDNPTGLTGNWSLLLFIAVAILAGGAFIANSESLLLFYPVLVSVVLLMVFAWSLYFPPSVIERLARLSEPELPASAVVYTRRVTVAWCFFFP